MTQTILLVEDDVEVRGLLAEELSRRFTVIPAMNGETALEQLAQRDVDVIVTDLEMRGMRGTDLCRRAADVRPDVPVIVITAFGSLEAAIDAIRAGAYDFVPKPFDPEALALVLDRAIQHRALRLEVKRLTRVVEDAGRFDELVGTSRAMQRVYELLAQVAESDVSVLLTGESGTGKELAARALHEKSRRRAGPFVALNCSAVPEQLLESQLFGHVKGAFTDAHQARPGLFVQASGGTLLLDEIGDMPLSLQPKLLRALQERAAMPVGADREVPFDVRLIASTHKDLEEEVRAGRFREDLFWRIDVVQIEMPPLRERGGDVLVLAQRFLKAAAARANRPVIGVSPQAAAKLMAYDWPGNVRELMNCMERSVALTRLDHISVDDLPERVRDHTSTRLVVDGEDPASFVTIDELEKRYILRVVAVCGGARKKAARILGIDRKTLYRKLVRYGVDLSSEEHDDA